MGCPVNGDRYGSRFAFSPMAKIKVLPPSSRRQAGVHRTPAFNWFDSLSFHSKRAPMWVPFYYGAGYGSRTRLHGLGRRCITDIRILRCVRTLYQRELENSTPFCRSFAGAMVQFIRSFTVKTSGGYPPEVRYWIRYRPASAAREP